MPLFGSTARRRSRTPPVVALLGVTFLLVGALTWQAYDTARSHLATTENALEDYATFAAWEYGRLAREELGTHAWNRLRALFYTDAPAGVAPGRRELAQAFDLLTAWQITDPPHGFFVRPLPQDGLTWVGGALDSTDAAWLSDTVVTHARAHFQPDWQATLIMTERAGRLWLVAYTLAPTGTPTRAQGLVLEPADALAIFDRVFRDAHLLPPSLVAERPNGAVLSLEVRSAVGELLYASAGRPLAPGEEYRGTSTLDQRLGGATVVAGLKPDVAGTLLIGGLPRSRLPLLLGLLAVTAGLFALTVRQFRRETELARVRADFVSGVSHELRTPLAQIRMFTETLLLERVRTGDERRRALDVIHREARRLTHLVENVLHFSRAERETIRLAPEPTRLDQLLKDLTDGFQPLAAVRGMTVRTTLASGLAAEVDPDALRQVVLNLLDNAVKYGPPDQTIGVTLSVEGGDAVIVVLDEGPGIPPEHRERVFEPFWRLPRDGESVVGGSGIGLAVVRELVALHGGTVQETGGGHGARFVVRLPGARVMDGPPRAPRERPASAGAEA